MSSYHKLLEIVELHRAFINDGFDALESMREKSETYQTITDIFGLCAVPSGPLEVQSLINTLNDSIGTMAMVNYPYPTSFVEPLPAWPVSAACDAAQTAFDAHY